MILLPLLTLLAADPAPDCKSESGQSACGYHCVANYSQVRCASTPQGICTAAEGRVICFDPPVYVINLMGSRLPEPACKVSSGQVACGYHCTAREGELKCASTPQGVCKADYGHVVCFDPPAAVFAATDGNVPEPECLAQDGHIACGYHCTSESGFVRCATTPWGVCKGRDRQLVCFDPPPAVICASRSRVPEPGCVVESGQITCGYHCATGHGMARCATTPDGSCNSDNGDPVCFDPPIAPPSDGPEATCFQTLGMAGTRTK